MKFHVAGLGFAVPKTVQTAEQLAPLIGWTAEELVRRTGVARRRITDEPIEMLGARAAREALGQVPPDLIINASATPRQALPDNSVFIQEALGYSGIPSFSVHATCLSFMVATRTALALLQCGAHQRILVVSAEGGTVSRNFAHPESASLIGDGAAAAVFEVGDPTAHRPEGAALTEVRGFGVRHHPNDANTTHEDNLFSMDGPRIFRLAHKRAFVLIRRLLEEAGVTPDEVDVVVPHQASNPALKALTAFGFGPDRVINIVGEYGNCIAASTPMALYEAQRTGRLRPGARVLMLGTGAGLSVAAALFCW
jgi:3-oxoacyl-[acyl-carrier-protein] synthase-3